MTSLSGTRYAAFNHFAELTWRICHEQIHDRAALLAAEMGGGGERVFSRGRTKYEFREMIKHGIFPEDRMGSGNYDQATISFATGKPVLV
jgi:hypothetical protein